MVRDVLVALAVGLVALPATAHADPPRLRARGSLRDGLRVEACEGSACTTWVRFAALPYRSFVEASFSPSGRFFYVWSKPDETPREIDVFAVPARRGAQPERVGHWAPGTGGSLEWTAGDHLWHVWGCGAACQMGALYGRDGTVLVDAVGLAVERSPDGRRALSVDGNHRGGVLIDLTRGTQRTFESPAEMSYDSDVRWRPDGVSVRFASGEADDETTLWVEVQDPPSRPSASP